MNRGEEFENKCHGYLVEKYGGGDVEFLSTNSSDSTVSDILVKKKCGDSFYIESKSPVSQSGQFVVRYNSATNTFSLSPRNKHKSNSETQKILQELNNDAHNFSTSGTAGRNINIPLSVMSEWIIQHYKDKDARYFMTEYGGNLVIAPIEKIADYFSIRATCREKKSGSSPTSRRAEAQVKSLISLAYPQATFSREGRKLFTEIDGVSQDEFTLDKYTYYLSPKGGSRYEVRKLSNTKNISIVFSIESKSVQDKQDLDAFEKDIS